MKKQLLLLSMLSVSCISLYAQQKNVDTKTLQKLESYLINDKSKISAISLKDSSYQWLWDAFDNTWQFPDKAIFKYNANHDLNNIETAIFDGNVWNPSTQFDNYVYDSNGNLTQVSLFTWNTVLWEKTTQENYTYNSNNLQNSYVEKDWDFSNAVWKNVKKDTIVFDINNNATSITSYNWNDTLTTPIWQGINRTLYTYDANQNPTKSVLQRWDTDVNAWFNEAKDSLIYTNNKLTTVISQNIDDNGGWANYLKMTNITYSLTNIISFEIQQWDDLSLAYISNSKQSSVYTNTLLTQRLNQIYDITSSTWINDFKEDYTYDSFNNNTIQITQVWIQDSLAWFNSAREFHYYSQAVGLKESKMDNTVMSLFPNPVSNLLNVKLFTKTQFNEIQVKNLLGEVVLSKYITSNEVPVIDLTTIPSGVYFVVIKNQTNSIIKKIIKE